MSMDTVLFIVTYDSYIVLIIVGIDKVGFCGFPQPYNWLVFAQSIIAMLVASDIAK